MDDVILDQFRRLLSGLSIDDPWPTLIESGFLDLMRAEAAGGAGFDLERAFPIFLEAGRHPELRGFVETCLARIVAPDAVLVMDAEKALLAGGVSPETARALAAAGAAALMAGAMLRVLELTVDYASTRKQFGRPIGGFQAVQHQISAMAEEVMAARIAVQAAFVGAPLEMKSLSAGSAKVRAGQAAITVGSVAHAVHGAIGVSHEHVLHLYTDALARWRLAHGGEAFWARAIGAWAIAQDGDFVTLARGL